MPFPPTFRCWPRPTDHKAIEFTRDVDRALLSGSALAQIVHINVEVTGPKNATADWLSRYQVLGRNEFSTSGFSKALGGLLRQLAQSCKQLRSVWVYASPAESDVQAQRQVQQDATPSARQCWQFLLWRPHRAWSSG
jgi:hypothetical protein